MTAVAPSMFIGIGELFLCLEDPLDRLGDDARTVPRRRRPARHRRRAASSRTARGSTPMPTMAEAGDDLAVRGAIGGKHASDDVIARVALASSGVDRVEQLHALLAGAAVDIVERIDRRRHRAVEWQAARHAPCARWRSTARAARGRPLPPAPLRAAPPAPVPESRRAASATPSRESAACRSAPGSGSRGPGSCPGSMSMIEVDHQSLALSSRSSALLVLLPPFALISRPSRAAGRSRRR